MHATGERGLRRLGFDRDLACCPLRVGAEGAFRVPTDAPPARERDAAARR
jgi:hypothetical protein